MTTQEQSIEESLETMIQHFNNNIHTCMPGKIEKIYNLNNKRFADIKPTVKNTAIRDGEKVSTEYPIIPMVPLFIQGDDIFFMSFPVKVGNSCVLHMIQHSIDKYLLSDGKTDVDSQDIRRHDINDAFAVVGDFLANKTIASISPDNLVIGKKDGSSKITITPDNKISFESSTINNIASHINLGSDSASNPVAKGNETQDSLNDIASWIVGAAVPLAVLGYTATPPVPKNVKSSKVKLDS